MRNEDRIVELLAESLVRQDKMLERQNRFEEILLESLERLTNQEKLLGKVVSSINELTDVFKTKFDQVNGHEKRIRRLEDKIIN